MLAGDVYGNLIWVDPKIRPRCWRVLLPEGHRISGLLTSRNQYWNSTMVLMERERERETRLLARQFRSTGQCTAITVSYSCTVGWKPNVQYNMFTIQIRWMSFSSKGRRIIWFWRMIWLIRSQLASRGLVRLVSAHLVRPVYMACWDLSTWYGDNYLCGMLRPV